MANPLRIPFAVAVKEPRLLQPFVYGTQEEAPGISVEQRVALFTLYGLPLGTTPVVGKWSEQDIWAAQQGFGEYNDIGQLVGVHPYPAYEPKEYPEGWIVAGIRSGKTHLAAVIVAYEAVCGGHEAFIRKGKQAVCFQVCQDLRFARYSLHGIRSVLESMPFVMQPYQQGERIRAVTADRIDLWNGITVATCPPTVKSIRGYDAPIAVLDEVGVWYQDADAANPDFEVYRAVSSRQAQFSDPKVVGISSPWNKGGMLYERFLAGTEGMRLHCSLHPRATQDCPACGRLRRPHRNRVVIHATTASMGNPLVAPKWLRDEREKDPKAFERECLAVFQDSISGFLDSKRLAEAVETGVVERAPQKGMVYVAAMDPAFKRDAFAFAVGHVEPIGVVFDLIRQIRRDPAGPPLNPEVVFETEVLPALQAYGVATVHTDQYHFESLQQLAIQKGFSIDCTMLTATSKAGIFGNLKQLVNQRRLRLLDHPETLKELGQLELQLGEQGNVKIAAPKGQHDDLASVVALVAHHATWLLPQVVEEHREGGPVKQPTPHEAIVAKLAARRAVVDTGGEVWD